MKRLYYLLLTMFITGSLYAQDESKGTQFRLAIIGSMPDDIFGSESVTNEDAGFAKFGGGAEMGFKLFVTDAIFIPLRATYIGRGSTLIESTIEFQNALPNSETWELESEAKWRHVFFETGVGYEFGSSKFRIAPSLNVGLANTILTESSFNTPQAFVQFDRSNNATFLYGASMTFTIDQALFIEASYVNVGKPEFQFLEDFPETAFEIPISMINFKLGFLLYNSRRVQQVKS